MKLPNISHFSKIRSARENVGKPCNMCSNYEVQLQSIQDKEQKNTDHINSLRLVSMNLYYRDAAYNFTKDGVSKLFEDT